MSRAGGHETAVVEVARIVAERVGTTGAVVGVDLNPGMLTVARSVAATGSRSGAPIEWREANADKLPFPGESFHVVYCQLGLQFFADRVAALREMRRVLCAEGRLALMVWRSIHESPGFAVLAESLERHVGQAAAAMALVQTACLSQICWHAEPSENRQWAS
ncbi:Methyltransferase domain-containing protein [Rhizobiales bacterium GAS113]|nr:Methyltransferase domain-containing protein [Rhizobiales bacterium GAS113]